ncbi:MAG: hypothetical protein ACOC0R_00905 [Mariniphaga sp.]
MNKKKLIIILFLLQSFISGAQCLSSVNPVGGTDNMLVLEKKSLRIISFYRYGQGNRYYEGNQHAEYNLIDKAFYNYLSTIAGYGLSGKLTLELETGYFFNKTQKYNLSPQYALTGKGLSNAAILAKQSLFTEPFKRLYVTGSAGVKFPFSRELQQQENVTLPVEVQPASGAFGAVLGASLVKESSGTGRRYFLTSRFETNAENKENYRLGNMLFSSIYISQHLKHPKLKDKWTAILQVRHELRTSDRIKDRIKEASGSSLLFVAPQLNYVLNDEWYLSGMADIPAYQNFNGTQLGAGLGFTFIVSRTFRL